MAGEGSVSNAVSSESLVPQDTSDYDIDISVPPGFEVQRLYEVPGDDRGSWVGLAVLPDGDLVASDQQDEGFFRIRVTGDIDDPEVEVEDFILPISGAQGLLWAFDHLYANVNGVGLFRLGHSRGETDRFNTLEYFEGSPDGAGEHGNHAIIPTEDGEGLYIVNGNFTPLPDSYTSRVASWDEDLLLPRNWDARGHARGVLAPGGYIARVNPEATEWEIISIGMRNSYDIAVNEHGDLFAWDSDMEWDMGMPWYRPIRIMHAVSGSDQGWRSGSGKWKEYFEDSIPATYNIGPGSPTGLLFGTGAAFPEQYQRALYALDWTFGTIYALHMTPEGASYRVDESEEFLTGSPLPLTDAVVGKDGHLYFATGGRGQQSYLYRVVYRGDESTAPAEPVDNPEAREARELRQQLEAFHGQEDPEAVEMAWPHLDSEDRFIRHAARVAIEWQPVDTWAERALNENRPQARITALVALARMGSEDYSADALESLIEMDTASLTADQRLGYLRAMSLVFMRLGDPDEQQRAQIADGLYSMLPDDDDRVNVELVRNMVYLDDPRVIEQALALMQRDTPPSPPDWDEGLLERSEQYGTTIIEMMENPPPINELEFAFMLRNMRDGWTVEQRREYFTFINEAADRAGGASYTGFLERMREQALENATDDEIEAVADLTGVSLAGEPDFEIYPPEGPGREWTVVEAEDVLFGDQTGWNRQIVGDLDFERGRSLYHATTCAACHRFDGYGGNIGPDLTTVADRFGVMGVVEKLIHPNENISDQYSSSEVVLHNGETIVGLVVRQGDQLEIYSQDPDAEPTIVPRSDVERIRQVNVSQMPPGLINPLNPDELRDLMAYLVSRGNSDADVYGVEDDETAEAAPPAEGVDPAGTWSYNLDIAGGGTITITGSPDNLSGTMVSDNNSDEVELDDVRLSGNTLRFSFHSEQAGDRIEAYLDIEGDDFEGRFEVPGVGDLSITGSRADDA